MKNLFLFIFTVIMANIAVAQNVSLKNNIIYANSKPYAQLKKWKTKPLEYTINSLDGKELLSVHHSRLFIKGQPGYCITFLNDNKKALMVNHAKSPAMTIIKEIVKNNLINGGYAINEQAESRYILSHPLPDGYVDVDELIEY